MFPPSSTWLQRALITVGSALVYGLAFWLNDVFTDWILYTQGVSLVYLPAGVKLLLLLIAGWPAALGMGLMLWALSLGFWPQVDAAILLGGAVVSVGTTWAVIHLSLRLLGIGSDLMRLGFFRLVLLDACASIVHGWLMNGYYALVGERAPEAIASSAWAMALGDFTGSGLLLMLLLALLRWSPLRHRLAAR